MKVEILLLFADIIDAVRVPYKCRIPQRLQYDRQSGIQHRNKVNNTDVMVKIERECQTSLGLLYD